MKEERRRRAKVRRETRIRNTVWGTVYLVITMGAIVGIVLWASGVELPIWAGSGPLVLIITAKVIEFLTNTAREQAEFDARWKYWMGR